MRSKQSKPRIEFLESKCPLSTTDPLRGILPPPILVPSEVFYTIPHPVDIPIDPILKELLIEPPTIQERPIIIPDVPFDFIK